MDNYAGPEDISEAEKAIVDKALADAATSQGTAIYDAGRVIMMVGGPGGKMVPVPLPVVMEQLFAVLADMDQRLQAVEAAKPKEEESRILRV